MLTTVAKGRTYDFSHAVGGLYMPQPIGVAAGEGDTVYVLSRQYEQILDVPWNKTGTSAQVKSLHRDRNCRRRRIPGALQQVR